MAVALHLTSMVEDHHDSASSRNSRVLALRLLLDHLTPTHAERITHRLLAVNRAPHLSESDQWEISSNVPLSRARFRSGAESFADNVLRVAAEAWAASRETDEELTQGDRAFAQEVAEGALPLLQDPEQQSRIRGARCISALARGASQFAHYAIGLTLHNCEYVRAIGVPHVPRADPLLVALAGDSAPWVRASVAQRAEDLPQHVLDALRNDLHLGVRRTLAAAMAPKVRPTST